MSECDSSEECGTNVRQSESRNCENLTGSNPEICVAIRSPNSSCASSVVGAGSILDFQFDPLCFKSSFLQVIEELRLKRVIIIENELQIKKLVAEKHDLQMKLENEASVNKSLVEKHSEVERKLRVDFQDNMKSVECDEATRQVTVGVWDEKIKSLKEEIRAYQLVKYNLEKKVAEQGKKLSVLASSRESHFSQVKQLEHRCSAVMKQVADVSDHIDTLEANARKSKDLQQKLHYVNEHMSCELEMCVLQLQQCRRELVQARVSSTKNKLERSKAINTEIPEFNYQDYKRQVELNKQLQSQLSSLRKEHQDVLCKLKSVHSIMERHNEHLNSAVAEKEKTCLENTKLRDKVSELNGSLENSLKSQDTLAKKLSDDDEAWSAKYDDVESRLKSLQAAFTRQQDAYDKELKKKSNTLSHAELSMNQLKQQVTQLDAQLKEVESKRELLLLQVKNIDGGVVQKAVQGLNQSIEEIASNNHEVENDNSTGCQNSCLLDDLKSSVSGQTSQDASHCVVDDQSESMLASPVAGCDASQSASPLTGTKRKSISQSSQPKKLKQVLGYEKEVPSGVEADVTGTEDEDDSSHIDITSMEAVESATSSAPAVVEIGTIFEAGVNDKDIEQIPSLEDESDSDDLLLFPEDENLINTQLSKQINRVAKILKFDKLKVPKKYN